MNVLSLFDGMSCGMIALERAGVKVDNYFASEIDAAAIAVSKSNYPNIIRLGDIEGWKQWDLNWANIDLVIGGSPCQGFSFAGKQLLLEDTRSRLFLTYCDILNHIQVSNTNVKFLLENTYMPKRAENIISDYLKCSPLKINSNKFSAQNRRRLYWFNFDINSTTITENNLVFRDIQDISPEESLYLSGRGLNKIKSKRARIFTLEEKAPCLMASQSKKPTDALILKIDSKYRYPTRLEMERLQTVPDDYTACVDYNSAAKMLGNGWTVDVIAHIFSGIK